MRLSQSDTGKSAKPTNDPIVITDGATVATDGAFVAYSLILEDDMATSDWLPGTRAMQFKMAKRARNTRGVGEIWSTIIP
jgi:hypothetical protein